MITANQLYSPETSYIPMLMHRACDKPVLTGINPLVMQEIRQNTCPLHLLKMQTRMISCHAMACSPQVHAAECPVQLLTTVTPCVTLLVAFLNMQLIHSLPQLRLFSCCRMFPLRHEHMPTILDVQPAGRYPSLLHQLPLSDTILPLSHRVPRLILEFL